MNKFGGFLFAVLAGLSLAVVQVNARNQTGFISLDCGLPRDSLNYTETTTGINYISDYSFVETGVAKRILPEFDIGRQQQMWHLRSFPEGDRNCYSFNLTKGSKYLIRAYFMYGNYDGLGKLRQFDLYTGPNKWATISITSVSRDLFAELIHVLPTSYLQVCLVNTGSGVPFINALEIRPMEIAAYGTDQSVSLNLHSRLDVGSIYNLTVRFEDDVYDRTWWNYISDGWRQLSTNLAIDFNSSDSFKIPSVVMRTAVVPANLSSSLDFFMHIDHITHHFYVYFHFAEILKLPSNESREMNLFVDGKHWYGPFTPNYLSTTSVKTISPSAGGNLSFSIQRTENSTLPPILNAVELYSVPEGSQSPTDQTDVDAIMKIKSSYGVKRNWQGDPCAPIAYLWNGINCSYNGNDPSRIISLYENKFSRNLSSSGLTGVIPLSLINLTMIEQLDLSLNDLTGSVPEFLAELSSLKVLNLTGNNLIGSLPADLIKRSNNHSLLLSVSGNPHLCESMSCQRKDNVRLVIIPVAASSAALFVILIALATWWSLRRRKQAIEDNAKASFELRGRHFTYSEVLRITDNFKRVLGRGGFGTVYHGNLDGSQVAVKMLSSSSSQGYKEFITELKILMKVHHRNLTNIVGYCKEGAHMGLIYEYMANGNLKQRLSDRNATILSWVERLRISVDAAQGLEYLHRDCKPPIIHRDIKSTNILLNENFEAKLADFGLSRIFPIEECSHVSTGVAGTPGYLDPEYHVKRWLNEKSDVYSFGVVLLEIFTSRPVITKVENEDDHIHISKLVSSIAAGGNIEDVIDPGLLGDFEIISAKKAVELALKCSSHTSSERPYMNEVVEELKVCLTMELARKTGMSGIELDN
ncbi:LRR receptor-like serine/threonine-protein kinase IOS1 [Mangifera indica]|uniref:LRR receptor-like serine/threonine-protein kinase IOS1 n=1 Tax=Mangifera indica TaxID=29780 RepID=UPI001CFBBED4|nr:LRR receptor-like serine/threonine-protein kinase IOS1 [Mangifera indica]